MDRPDSEHSPNPPDEARVRRALQEAGVERPPGALDHALALVRFLRSADPWDARQTPDTLVPHLLEEAHEVADAIRAGRTEALEAELGDLLLNLAFQLVVAEERGRFDAASVIHRLERKIVLRHPHLFGLGPEVGWEEAKARERGKRGEGDPAEGGGPAESGGRRNGEVGLLEAIEAGPDPLLAADRLQRRAAEVGFDWPDFHGALAKVLEEAEEVRTLLEGERNVEIGGGTAEGGRTGEGGSPLAAIEDELGDLLFAAVNLARLAGVRADTALVRANRKFVRRFGALERMARERGVDLEEASLEELDAIWEEVKEGE